MPVKDISVKDTDECVHVCECGCMCILNRRIDKKVGKIIWQQNF